MADINFSDLPKLLKPDEVAAILQISKTHAYRLGKEGRIPCIRFGRTVRFRSEDVARFIAGASTAGGRM